MRASLFLGIFVALTIFPSTLSGQRLYLGVKGGIRTTDTIRANYGYHAEGIPLTVGPSAEILLPHSIGIEVDALYRRSGYSFLLSDPPGSTATGKTLWDSVDIPILAKRYLRWSGWHWRPYVAGGYAVRIRTGPTATETDSGLLAGTGIRLRTGRYRIWPEFRYTRWFGLQQRQDSRGAFFGLNPNQAEILVGITF